MSKNMNNLLMLLIGLSLSTIAKELNRVGTVNWATVFVALTGLVCIIFAVINFLNGNKSK
jgi:uncharacterized Tic20 family protein